MSRQDDRNAQVDQLTKDGEKLVEEKAKAASDDVGFFQKMGSASSNLKNFIKSKMGTILATGLAQTPFSKIAGQDMGDALALLGSAVDKMAEPAKVKGTLESADSSDKNFLLSKTKEVGLGVAKLGGVMTSSSAKPRVKDIVIGSFGAAASLGSKYLNEDMKNFQAFSVLTSMAFIHEPKAVWGIAEDAMKGFGTKNLARRGILEAIKLTVNEIYDELTTLDPGWYGLNIKQRIIDAKSELTSADEKLLIVRRKTYQRLFDSALFDDASEDVQDAIDLLSDYSGIALDFGMLQVQTLLIVLNRLTDRLQILQDDIDDHKKNVQDFAVNLIDESRFDNMSATLISNIQNQLRNTMREMDKTVSSAPKLKIIQKMATWVLRLNIIHALMSTTGKLLKNYLDTDPDGYRSIFDDIGDQIADIDFYQEDKNIEVLIWNLRRFHSEVTQKMSVDLPLGPIEYRRDEIVRLIDAQLDKSSLITDILLATPDVASSLIADGGKSIATLGGTIVDDFKGMADDMGFDRIKTSLETGSWKNFFSATSQNASSEGNLKNQISDLKKSSETPVEKVTEQKMDALSDKLEKSRREKRYASRSVEEIQAGVVTDVKRDIKAAKLLNTYIREIRDSEAERRSNS